MSSVLRSFHSSFLIGLNLLLIVSFLQSCEQAGETVPPVVITGTVNNVTANSAVIDGQVTDDGEGMVSSRGIAFGVSPSPTVESGFKAAGSGLGTFTANLEGLNPGTTYYARAYATNEAGTSYGLEVSFNTVVLEAAVTTAPVVSITSTGAVSGGTVTTDGGGGIQARGVCWSTSANPVPFGSQRTVDGTGTGSFQSTITGLTRATKYYLRAYATNSAGTAYGEQVEFTTPIQPPTLVISQNPSFRIITPFSAQFAGFYVSDNGGSSLLANGICWNTSPNPTIDHAKTDDGATIRGYGDMFVLSPETKYYVRVYATNAAGTTYSQQFEITTDKNISCYKNPLVFSGDYPRYLFRQTNDQVLVYTPGYLNRVESTGIRRITSSGLVDPGYLHNNGGRYIQSISDAGNSKVLVSEDDASYVNTLYRLNADGSVDPTFTRLNCSALGAPCRSVERARLSDKYYVQIGGNRIIRLNNDGTVDPSFEQPASVLYVGKMMVQPDDRVLILTDGNVLRLDATGAKDDTFTTISAQRYIVHQLADGSILNFQANGIIERYDSEGVLQATSSNPVGLTNCTSIQQVEQLSNGKIVVSGTATDGGGWSFYRLNSDLSRDNTFAIGTGFTNPDVSLGSISCNGQNMTAITGFQVLSDGSMVVAGQFSNFNGARFWSLIRLNADGSVCP